MSWFCWHDWLIVRETTKMYRYQEATYYTYKQYRFEWHKCDKICRKCGKLSLKLAKATIVDKDE